MGKGGDTLGGNTLFTNEIVADLDPSLLETSPQEADIFIEDLRALIAAGIIEAYHGSALNYCKLFTVDETHKSRRRLIVWPRSINAALTNPGDVILPSFDEILVAASAHRFGATFDFEAFFNHFEISAAMQPFYCFRFQNETYTMRVIATGQRQCPSLAQALSRSICDTIESIIVGVKAFAYVDNILLLGNDTLLLENARSLLRSICADITVALDEEEFGPRFTFLGVSFDLEKQQIAIAAKSVSKLQDALNTISDCLSFTSPVLIKQILSWFGLFCFAARILALPLAGAYPILKYLRRVANKPTGACVTPWPSALRNLASCISSVLSFPADPFLPVASITRSLTPAPSTDSPPHILYTDACLSGWGTVFFTPQGEISVSCGPFDFPEDIQVLEGRALLRGTQRLPINTDPNATLVIRIDSTSVSGGLRRTWHRNFTLNSILPQIVEVISLKGWLHTKIEWVSSLSNLADLPSRAFEVKNGVIVENGEDS